MPDEQAWTLLQRGRALALQGHQNKPPTRLWPQRVCLPRTISAWAPSGVGLARAELALANGDAANAVELAAQAAAGYAAPVCRRRFRADVVRANAPLRAGSVGEPGRSSTHVVARARELQLLTLQVRCLTGLGLAAQALGDPAAGVRPSTQPSSCSGPAAGAARGMAAHRLLTEHPCPYQRCCAWRCRRMRTPLVRNSRHRYWFKLDRFRARALGERLAQGASIEDNASTQGLRDRELALSARAAPGCDGEFSAALTGELRRTEQELLERARRARLAAPAPERARVGDDCGCRNLAGPTGRRRRDGRIRCPGQ
jgi:hypothetical protein